MKIVFLTPNLETHGGNLVMLKYADFLVGKGHQVSIVTSDKISLKLNKKIKLINYKHFPIRYVDFFLLQSIYYWRIMDLIPECDFVIPIYTPLLIPAVLAKRKKNFKLIHFFQDNFKMIWAGPWIRKIVSLRKISQSIDKVICISEALKASYEEVSPLAADVITNGIDLDIFYDRKLEKEMSLLFVGRPQLPKGFPYFKKAFLCLREKYPNLKAIVATPMKVSQKVEGMTFMQNRSREELAILYSKSLIYVSASLSESFGLPPLEAMASGTAVVMTATLGSKEYALDRKNCFLVPIGDAKALEVTIEKLIGDPVFRSKLEKSGLKTARNYGWSKSLDKFELLLERTI